MPGLENTTQGLDTAAAGAQAAPAAAAGQQTAPDAATMLNELRAALDAAHEHAMALRRLVEELADLVSGRRELQQLRAENAELKLRIKEAATPLSSRELLRRARVLSERADTVEGGLGVFAKRICQFCGAAKRPTYLEKHIRRQHVDELSAMGPEAFA